MSDLFSLDHRFLLAVGKGHIGKNPIGFIGGQLRDGTQRLPLTKTVKPLFCVLP